MILIIVSSIFLIKGAFFEKKTKEAIFEEIITKLPKSEKGKFIKRTSFIQSSKSEISQFIISFYDENQNGFKIKKDSTVSLEATYYGIEALHNLKSLNVITNSQTLFDKIRSYYISPDYYLEKNKDPIFSTKQALRIDRWYQEDLNQKIDLDWLKSNSIENKNLELEKFNPEYQLAVVQIYQHLEQLEVSEKLRKIEEISYPYFDYYCNFQFPEEISDSDYLKIKYYQISLISNLSGVTNIVNSTASCFKEENIKINKERLNKFNYEKLDDIKEVYWLYYLQSFYNLDPDLNQIFDKVQNFYFEGGFKEKLSDEAPSLIGTYYGTLFIK